MKRIEFIRNTAGTVLGTTLISSFSAIPNEKSKIRPKALLKGDLIGITAPAGSIWNKTHIDKIQRLMTEMGFKIRLGKTLYEQDGYLAGNDKIRAEELMAFYQDKQVKAIITMRGGWGCQRILGLLNYQIIRENPKIIIGFSDITSLINVIYDKTGVITYHGPCGYSSWGNFTIDQVKKALVYGQPYQMENPKTYNISCKTWVGGKARGELIGGNLTVLCALIGTEYEPNWKNKILCLEEIGEEPYRVDRMLWQMKQANVFRLINGLVIGSFKNCHPEEPHKSFSLNEVFKQHFSNIKIPIYEGAAFGHIAPKFTLPLGIEVEIDADEHNIRTLERSVII